MCLPLGLLLVILTLSGSEASDPAQCRKPAGGGIYIINQLINGKYRPSGSQEYYNPGDVIAVWCQTGYYPPHGTYTCQSNGTGSDWDEPVSCTAQCKKPAGGGIYIIYQVINDDSIPSDSQEYYNPGDVIDVECQTGYYSPHGTHTCQSNGTGSDWDKPVSCTAIDQPEIVKYPNIEENIIQWSLNTSWGIITGYQMNISARRDYNNSFAENESLWFPPNVTEFKIPFKYGTNYTINLRGLTSAGAGRHTQWSLETPVADPPLPVANIRGVDSHDLHLHPVPDINGPIRTYEIMLSVGQAVNSSDVCMGYNSTHYHSSNSLYTAALLPPQNLNRPMTLTLGDGVHYSGFFNAPLISNQTYTVYVRVSSTWREVEKSSCSIVGTFTAGRRRAFNTYLSVSSIVKSVFVLIPVVLVCLIVRRKCQKEEGSAAQLKEKPNDVIYENTENL